MYALGAKKGIVGSHNDPSNIEDWITTTTPTLIILEKVSTDYASSLII